MAIGRTNCGAGGSIGGLPQFTYTGEYTLLDDGDKNWRIKLLTSGTLTFTKAPGLVDVFLVGGGGGASGSVRRCGGGAGGKTLTTMISLEATSYDIVIGSGGNAGTTAGTKGGDTTAFGLTATGGGAGKGGSNTTDSKGGSGGTGGSGCDAGGGEDGSNGKGSWPGTGQGTTTREFGEEDGDLYSGGGAGGGNDSVKIGGMDWTGITYYGSSDASTTYKPVDRAANTGSGGCGGVNGNGINQAGAKGGSGIVIIRNKRG